MMALIAMQLHPHRTRALLHSRKALRVKLRLREQDVNAIGIDGLANGETEALE